MVPVDIGYLVIWILFLLFIQVSIFLLISKIIPNHALPISFTVSILFFGLVSWYLTLLQLPIQIMGVIFFLLFIGGVLTFKERQIIEFKNGLNYYIFFLAFFSVLLLTRFLTPDNIGNEFFMDFGIIHSMYRYPVMPPADLWFGGAPLNVYYYFGQWIFAAPGMVLKIPPSILYTLALPSVFAYSAVNLYAIGRLMLKKYQHLTLLVLLIPIPAMVVYLFTGIGFSESFSNCYLLIPGTATEWAFSSFITGDMHAHVVAILVQTFILYLFILILLNYRIWSGREKILVSLITGVSLGVLMPVNTWNIFVFAPLLLIVGFILVFYGMKKESQNPDPAEDLPGGGCIEKINPLYRLNEFLTPYSKEVFFTFYIIIPALSILLYLPYYLQSQGRFLFPAIVPVPSPLGLFFLFWGFFFIILFLHYRSEIRRFPWILLVFIPGFIIGYGAAAVPAILMLYALIRRKDITDILNFWGLFLVLLCEFFYLRDFTIEAAFRFNTVFKIYSSVWLILGASCAIIAGKFFSEKLSQARFHQAFQYLPVICTIVLLVSVIPFGLALFPSETAPTLRSDAFLTTTLPQDYTGIVFLRNMTGAHLMVEGSTFLGDYRNQGRVSIFSGIPAVLGQYMHEVHWRGQSVEPDAIMKRVLYIQMVYEKPDLSLYAFDQLGADLLYVGPLEKDLYNVSLPEQGFDTIYDHDGVKILRRNDYPAPVLDSINTSMWIDIPDIAKWNKEFNQDYHTIL